MAVFLSKMFSSSQSPNLPSYNSDRKEAMGDFIVKQQYLQSFFERKLSKKGMVTSINTIDIIEHFSYY